MPIEGTFMWHAVIRFVMYARFPTSCSSFLGRDVPRCWGVAVGCVRRGTEHTPTWLRLIAALFRIQAVQALRHHVAGRVGARAPAMIRMGRRGGKVNVNRSIAAIRHSLKHSIAEIVRSDCGVEAAVACHAECFFVLPVLSVLGIVVVIPVAVVLVTFIIIPAVVSIAVKGKHKQAWVTSVGGIGKAFAVQERVRL